jgi:hypothetical protein
MNEAIGVKRSVETATTKDATDYRSGYPRQIHKRPVAGNPQEGNAEADWLAAERELLELEGDDE